jgi:hypothetical protein
VATVDFGYGVPISAMLNDRDVSRSERLSNGRAIDPRVAAPACQVHETTPAVPDYSQPYWQTPPLHGD